MTCLDYLSFEFQNIFLVILAFSLFTPLYPSKYGFSQGTISIWFVLLVAGLRIISTHRRHSGQVRSIASGMLFSFPTKSTQWLLYRAGEMSVVLIFGICNVYEIVAYYWLYSQYWVWLKMVDMASKFLGSISDWCLFFVC